MEMDILKVFKQKRSEKQLSTRDMGKLLNMSYGTYRDIENGKIRLSLENFLAICQKLGIDPVSLIEDDNNEHFILSNQDFQTLTASNEVIKKIIDQGKTKPQSIEFNDAEIHQLNISMNGDKNKQVK
jgi:transcriptional regulator with XRE-family HTH domain